MSGVKYEFIKNEKELINKINTFDKVANSYIMQIENLYFEDLFFMALIDKSIKLIESFLFALEKRNITVLATLTRVQIDCTLRAFASTMVNDSREFCKSILFDNKRINQLKDSNNIKMTDKHLCEAISNYLNLPVYELYQKVCGFVHFSSYSFYNMAKAHEEYDISMFISRRNRAEDEKEFERLSIELGNQFLFFGSVLVEDIFASWLQQNR